MKSKRRNMELMNLRLKTEKVERKMTTTKKRKKKVLLKAKLKVNKEIIDSNIVLCYLFYLIVMFEQ
jgi:hypothetical protein